MTRRVSARPGLVRLSRSADVRRALRQGRRRSGRLVSLHGLLRPSGGAVEDQSTGPGVGLEDVRLTVVASRRVGNAVQRNRAKRLMREAARTQPWRPGLDVVLVARGACPASGLGPVTEELRTLGGALGLLADGLQMEVRERLEQQGPADEDGR